MWINVGEVATAEQAEVLTEFIRMLKDATADGSNKRARGEKPSWKVDPSHEAAIFSHLNKWKHGEKQDKDSGAHPLVHLAWRALAIAWQERRDQWAEFLGRDQQQVSLEKLKKIALEHDKRQQQIYRPTRFPVEGCPDKCFECCKKD